MSSNKALQISSRASRTPLTPEQERFDFLIGQIEKARKTRTEWEASILSFRQDYTQKLQPLRSALTDVCRQSAIALDLLLDQAGWTRFERAALRDMLCGTVDALLAANADDTEMKALFDKHSEIDFDTGKQEELQRIKAEAEAVTGLNLGGDAGILSEDDLVQRMYEEMTAQEEAAAARQAAKEQRQRKSAAQKRREDEAALAKQSLREIYRKLVSAVHPDRESDAQRREAKNALMQQINRAYEANDLLTLFEAQLQLEQIDADHVGSISTQRLKQYNKLLAEQLARLKTAISDIEVAFCMDYGLEPGSRLSPHKLGQVIQRQARMVRAELEQEKQFLLVLADKAAIKRWLKQRRRVAREVGYFDDGPF